MAWSSRRTVQLFGHRSGHVHTSQLRQSSGGLNIDLCVSKDVKYTMRLCTEGYKQKLPSIPNCMEIKKEVDANLSLKVDLSDLKWVAALNYHLYLIHLEKKTTCLEDFRNVRAFFAPWWSGNGTSRSIGFHLETTYSRLHLGLMVHVLVDVSSCGWRILNCAEMISEFVPEQGYNIRCRSL